MRRTLSGGGSREEVRGGKAGVEKGVEEVEKERSPSFELIEPAPITAVSRRNVPRPLTDVLAVTERRYRIQPTHPPLNPSRIPPTHSPTKHDTQPTHGIQHIPRSHHHEHNTLPPPTRAQDPPVDRVAAGDT